ncbi:uncharacterized protein LOC124168355 [Ischnura elegans]|uniref:uncharacterized protein LOC124153794 n=1 Tax=Ischnura elegans TaxID=197161 RepID=UPI001ED88CDA|nr:uncharacterized protein LOC124153794 [Ischnura elegans]XP_046402508.1 uncharacterized protein LOC124168355 [Ischnura elegans]
MPHDIVRKKLLRDGNGKVVQEVEFRCPKLTDDAIPLLFPGCPAYVSKPKARPRAKTPRKGCQSVKRLDLQEDHRVSQATEEETATTSEPLNEQDLMDTAEGHQFDFEDLRKGVLSNLPITWTRVIPFSGPEVVVFLQCVEKSGHVTCSILQKTVPNEILGLTNEPVTQASQVICSVFIYTCFKGISKPE